MPITTAPMATSRGLRSTSVSPPSSSANVAGRYANAAIATSTAASSADR